MSRTELRRVRSTATRWLLLLALAAIVVETARGAAFTWDGGGTNNNWSTAANWNPNGAPANNGSAAIHFAGSTRLAPNVDTAWDVQQIVFDSGASAFAIQGSTLTIQGLFTGTGTDIGITNNDGSTQTINNDIVMVDSQEWNAASGDLVINGDIAMTRLRIAGPNSTTLSGSISGSDLFLKVDTGTLTFSGSTSNTFPGTVFVQGGTLVLNKSTVNGAIAGNLQISPGATVRLDADKQIPISSLVTVGGALDLNGHNQVVGDFSIARGGSVTTGAGTLVVNGTFQVPNNPNTGLATISGNLSFNGATAELDVSPGSNADEDLDISAAISSGDLSVRGTVAFSGSSANDTGTVSVFGTLILRKSAFNGAIPGDLVIDPTGTVQLEANNQIAQTAGNTVTINGLGTFGEGVLALGNFSDTINDLALNGGTVSTSSSGLLTLVGNLSAGASTDSLITGRLRLGSGRHVFDVGTNAEVSITATALGIDSTSGIDKTGNGDLRLGAGTFSGGITHSGGTLIFSDDTSAGTGLLVLNGGTTTQSLGSPVLANALQLNGSLTLGNPLAPANGLTFSGIATLTGNTSLSVGGTTSFLNTITQDVAGRTLTKTGPGALVLGAANTFSGGFTLSGGTVRFGNDAAAGPGPLALNGSTVEAVTTARTLANAVSLNGSITFGGGLPMTFTGAATLTGNRTLTVSSGTSVTFANVIGQDSAGRILTKSGPGTLVLSAANTFSGGVVVSQGALGVGNNGAIGSGTLTLNSGTTIRAESSAITLPNAVTIGGSVTVDGNPDLTFAGPATITANATVNTIGSGVTTLSGAISQSGGTFDFTKAGAGTLVFTGALPNSYAGATTVTGTLVLAKSSSNGAITGSSLAINSTGVVRLDASDQIADATPVAISAGQLNLNGNSESVNTVSLNAGTITMGAGTLTLGNSLTTVASATTSSISGNLNLNGGTRTFTIADGTAVDDLSITALVSNGGLTKSGTGQMMLAGSVANTFAGTATVNDGTLVLNKSAVDGAFQGNLTVNGGVARLGASNQIPATPGNQVLVGVGQFDLAGFSDTIQDLVLNGGTVTTGAGALTIAGAISSLSSDTSATISGNLDLGGVTRSFSVGNGVAVNDLGVSALISNGGITKEAIGVLLLNRTAGNTYSGQTTINAGTLHVNNTSGSATGTGPVVVNSTGTLAGVGMIAGDVTVNAGGNIAPGASAGTLTVGALSLDPNSTSRFELNLAGTIGSNVNDLVIVNGALTLAGTLVVTELAGFGNGVYTLFDYSGALTNNGLAIQSGFLTAHPGSTIQIDSANTRVNLVVVPEPGAAATLIAGLATLLGFRRDRRRGSGP